MGKKFDGKIEMYNVMRIESIKVYTLTKTRIKYNDQSVSLERLQSLIPVFFLSLLNAREFTANDDEKSTSNDLARIKPNAQQSNYQ